MNVCNNCIIISEVMKEKGRVHRSQWPSHSLVLVTALQMEKNTEEHVRIHVPTLLKEIFQEDKRESLARLLLAVKSCSVENFTRSHAKIFQLCVHEVQKARENCGGETVKAHFQEIATALFRHPSDRGHTGKALTDLLRTTIIIFYYI